MRRVKLDRIDLQILKDLQNNGRITNVELSRRPQANGTRHPDAHH